MNLIPVIYICFGSIPDYLHINIELAARHNPVVILTNKFDVGEKDYDHVKQLQNISVQFVQLERYEKGAKDYAPYYRHLSKDHTKGRKTHELHCIQRWFVLKDYMEINNISHAFFGDGDSSVYTNITKAALLRSHCDVMINIDRQNHEYYWVGAGEASLWTLEGISDFCRFTKIMYQSYIPILEIKSKKGSSVVDMSLLWLWWVAHHDRPGWSAGRPYLNIHPNKTETEMKEFYHRQDEIFTFSKALKLPEIIKKLHICNGLDIINATVFDHQHIWTVGEEFNLNLNSTGIPTIKGLCLRSGGIPESIDYNDIINIEKSKREILINSVHYQGDQKPHIYYDVCRILVSTGNKIIYSERVKARCQLEFQRQPGMHCKNHCTHDGHVSSCT